jgi:hypothetical protein
MRRYFAGVVMVAACGGAPAAQPVHEGDEVVEAEPAPQAPEAADWQTRPRWFCTGGEQGGSCHNTQAECDRFRYVALDRGQDMRPCEAVEFVHCFVQHDDMLMAHCHRSSEECERGRAATGQWFRVGHCAKYGQRDSMVAIVSAVRNTGPDPNLQGPTRPLPASMAGSGWWCHQSDEGGPLDQCKRSEHECESSRAQLQDGRFRPCSFQKQATCVSWRDGPEKRITFACHATERSCSMMRRSQASRPDVDGVGACAAYE